MKPFNLEEAKAGKPVCTRKGRKARIICFDARNVQPIVALIEDADNRYEITYNYDNHGKWDKDEETAHDLMMVDEEPKCPFKPFDNVLVRDTNINKWECDIFNRYAPDEDIVHPFDCLTDIYTQCIPYNEETEHLIGTTDNAPEKYVIW